MLGFDWANNGSSTRAILMSFVYTAMICIPLILVLQYGVMQPMQDHWAKVDAEIKAKTAAELNSINNMNCQQLHDKLLSSDHFYDSDNEAIARDHYVAMCAVRLP